MTLRSPTALVAAAELGAYRFPQHWMGPVLQLFLMPGEATAEAVKAVATKMVIVENMGEIWELLGLKCMNDGRGCLNCWLATSFRGLYVL